MSTLIGFGSPNKADTHDVHGAPLGPEETAATRKNMGWQHGEFEVPQDVLDTFRQVCVCVGGGVQGRGGLEVIMTRLANALCA